ncbi:hypothetical protein [Rhodopseudomonas palustris]|nr:hypothetical protein [Rhodopseudomonas palustris]
MIATEIRAQRGLTGCVTAPINRAMLNALTTAKARRRSPAAWVDARV